MNPKCEKCNKYRDPCAGSNKLVVDDCFEEIRLDNNTVAVEVIPPPPEHKPDLVAQLSKPVNDRHENFQRILKKRLDMLTDCFRKISNLSGNNYYYTKEDADYIREQIKTVYAKTINKFTRIK